MSLGRALAIAGGLVVALLAVGCGDSGGGGADALRAELTAPGPYPVGVRSLPLTDLTRPGDDASRGPRFVYTEVWYPAAESARGQAPAPLYSYVPEQLNVLGLILGAASDLELPGVRDAPVAPAGEPFPVIGFSHGNTGVRFQNYTMAAHLASHGFVVFAPDHIGNAVFSRRADGSTVFFEEAFRLDTLADRIADMRFLISQFEGFGRPGSGSFLEGRLDTDRGFGISGHSFGGATAIGTAAQDARVVSVMPLASSIFPELNPPVQQPAFFAIATEDKTIGEAGNTRNADLYAASTGRKLFAEYVDAGHFSFADACELGFGLFGASDGCGSGTRFATGERFEFIPADDFWRIFNPQVTAFFRWTLRGDERMRAVLRSNPDPSEILYQSDRL